MPDKLPPLKALRAFHVTARVGSFSKAANELFVTPAAVGQQIKLLEDFFGLQLFKRTKKELILTDAGKTLAPLVSEGFDKFLLAARKVNALTQTNRLNISILPLVASKWLSPSLYQWIDMHPDIDVRIIAAHHEVDFDQEFIDFRICYGRIYEDNLHIDELFIDKVYPVCSPEVAGALTSELSEESLSGHTLLHVDWGSQFTSLPDWDSWFENFNFRFDKAPNGISFNLSSMAIQAAIDGKGILLGQHMFVAEDIAAGRLVKLTDLSLPLGEAYYLVYPESSLSKPIAVDFKDWLFEQIGK